MGLSALASLIAGLARRPACLVRIFVAVNLSGASARWQICLLSNQPGTESSLREEIPKSIKQCPVSPVAIPEIGESGGFESNEGSMCCPRGTR